MSKVILTPKKGLGLTLPSPDVIDPNRRVFDTMLVGFSAGIAEGIRFLSPFNNKRHESFFNNDRNKKPFDDKRRKTTL